MFKGNAGVELFQIEASSTMQNGAVMGVGQMFNTPLAWVLHA